METLWKLVLLPKLNKTRYLVFGLGVSVEDRVLWRLPHNQLAHPTMLFTLGPRGKGVPEHVSAYQRS